LKNKINYSDNNNKHAHAGIPVIVLHFYKMLHWINWIVLLSLEPLAGELKYASVVWSAAGAWAGRVSNV
jgi:hypothetical protein